ncbi:MAG: S8 family serine peptidase [Pseudomonadota bacterium]
MRLARSVAENIRAVRNTNYRRPRRERYRPSGRRCGRECTAFRLTNWTDSLTTCSQGIKLGMIDTQVDVKHPSLQMAKIELLNTSREDRRLSTSRHGTAVASLLVGAQLDGIAGVLPGSTLIAVNAFHRTRRGDQADTFDLISALDALRERGAGVINMSLTGPKNALLQDAVANSQAAGTLIVAAVGHPSRSAGYPAKYEGVVGVSAVDSRLRASRRSARGAHVAFAAPGVGLPAAVSGGKVRLVTGSSFAAPFVSAAFALELAAGKSREDARRALSATARDLGANGRDAVYGWGLIQFPTGRQC